MATPSSTTAHRCRNLVPGSLGAQKGLGHSFAVYIEHGHVYGEAFETRRGLVVFQVGFEGRWAYATQLQPHMADPMHQFAIAGRKWQGPNPRA